LECSIVKTHAHKSSLSAFTNLANKANLNTILPLDFNATINCVLTLEYFADVLEVGATRLVAPTRVPQHCTVDRTAWLAVTHPAIIAHHVRAVLPQPSEAARTAPSVKNTIAHARG